MREYLETTQDLVTGPDGSMDFVTYPYTVLQMTMPKPKDYTNQLSLDTISAFVSENITSEEEAGPGVTVDQIGQTAGTTFEKV